MSWPVFVALWLYMKRDWVCRDKGLSSSPKDSATKCCSSCADGRNPRYVFLEVLDLC